MKSFKIHWKPLTESNLLKSTLIILCRQQNPNHYFKIALLNIFVINENQFTFTLTVIQTCSDMSEHTFQVTFLSSRMENITLNNYFVK